MWIWTYLRTSGPNFHVVVPPTIAPDGTKTGGIYRSATPSPGNLAQWREQYGIRTWIDLRMPADYSDNSKFAAQCAAARTFGITRVSAPCSDREPMPDSTIDVVLGMLTTPGLQPVLIACAGGRHRTGLLVALYRMRVQGWPAETKDKKGAFDEAKHCGFYPDGHERFAAHFRKLLGLEAT